MVGFGAAPASAAKGVSSLGGQQASFKSTHPAAERRAMCVSAMDRNPDRLPVICEWVSSSSSPPSLAPSSPPPLPKVQFLVPANFPVHDFLRLLRQRLTIPLGPDAGLYVFCGAQMLNGSIALSTLHASRRDPEDGFLYLSCATENVFGG